MKSNVRTYALFLTLVTLLALLVHGCMGPATTSSMTGGQRAATPQATATPDQSQQTIKTVVEQSGAAQAAQQKGIAVTSQEDVATPRTHYGGEYHDVAVCRGPTAGAGCTTAPPFGCG